MLSRWDFYPRALTSGFIIPACFGYALLQYVPTEKGINLSGLVKIEKKKKESRSLKKKLWVNPGWDTPEFREFLTSLAWESGKGEIVYDQRNRLVHLPVDPQQGIRKDIIIKRFNLVRKYDQLRFRFIPSKAVRSLKTALALERIGVPTPCPVGLLEIRGRFREVETSSFVTEFCHYDFSLMDLVLSSRDHPEKKEVIKGLLPVLARDVRKMHDAGIIHNDLHDGNVLVVNTDPPVLYYIDLNRARLKKALSLAERAKDLARFNWKEELQRLFVVEYMPAKAEELMKLLIQERQKRVRVINLKRKLRQAFGRKKSLPQEQGERRKNEFN